MSWDAARVASPACGTIFHSFSPLSLSLSGEATFDKGKFIDGLNGASKLVRGFATIVDKGAGAMVSLKDRLGPRS